MAMNRTLAGKTIFISGGSRGIGREPPSIRQQWPSSSLISISVRYGQRHPQPWRKLMRALRRLQA
jgi:hypothetical protein